MTCEFSSETQKIIMEVKEEGKSNAKAVRDSEPSSIGDLFRELESAAGLVHCSLNGRALERASSMQSISGASTLQNPIRNI